MSIMRLRIHVEMAIALPKNTLLWSQNWTIIHAKLVREICSGLNSKSTAKKIRIQSSTLCKHTPRCIARFLEMNAAVGESSGAASSAGLDRENLGLDQ
jgi:hypothetical protein